MDRSPGVANGRERGSRRRKEEEWGRDEALEG
jgi:hypothetical protein